MASGALALVLVTAAMVALWWPSTAGAQGATCTAYAPTQMTITPSPVAPGAKVTVTGVALPDAPVTITLRKPDGSTSVLATGTATATGAFSIEAVIPADLPPGDYEVIGTSPNCPAPFTVVVPVTPPPGASTTSTTTSTTTTTAVVAGSSTTVPGSPTSVVPSVQEAGTGVLGSTETQPTAAAVEAAASGSDGALAFTGGEVRPFIVAAIAIIAVGALLVGSSRRRVGPEA